MTVFEKLSKRLKTDLGLKIKPDCLHRTYCGYWQKRAGGYLWIGYLDCDTPTMVGSCDTASACISKGNILEMSEKYNGTEIEIFVEPIK